MVLLDRRLAWAAALIAGGLAAAGCGSGGPDLTDTQVQRWLATVQQLANQPATASRCYLVPRAALPAVVSHPPNAWVVEGYNDQTTDGRRFAGCGIRAASGPSGAGEIGIELSSLAGDDPNPATRHSRIAGTGWTLFVTAWPGTAATSSAELNRVKRAVVAALAAPPSDPSAYAGPASPFG